MSLDISDQFYERDTPPISDEYAARHLGAIDDEDVDDEELDDYGDDDYGDYDDFNYDDDFNLYCEQCNDYH